MVSRLPSSVNKITLCEGSMGKPRLVLVLIFFSGKNIYIFI